MSLNNYHHTIMIVVTNQNSIVFDETAKIVGSEEWAVAASDTGGDWTWSSPPPFEKILEWVVKHSGLTNPKKQRAAAAGVRKKIAIRRFRITLLG